MDEYSEKNSSFPGLNKSHGFFNLIERNQRDRESYHIEQEEKKQARRLEVMKEIKSEKDSKRRPPKALYRPPQLRRSRPTPPAGPSSSGASLPVSQQQFKLEVELQPTLWWKGVVRYGEESEHVKELQQQYDLTPQLRDALSHIIQEFTERTF